jgi:alpha-tubulin suppressor-like RCC1 family protein
MVRKTPTPVTGGRSYISIFAGGLHTCAIDEDDEVFCWGANQYGQLGIGAPDNDPHTSPVSVPLPDDTDTMATGWYHTCAVALNGAVYCWGDKRHGQLGIGSASQDPTPDPQLVPGMTFTSMTAGGYHTCGVQTDQTAFCWGRNLNGQVGYAENTFTDVHTPTPVFNSPSFPIVSAGSLHTCALAADGTPWCWGDNNAWQLGMGETEFFPNDDQPVPVKVDTDLRFGQSGGGS